LPLDALVIYEDDARRITERLDAFLVASRATFAILIDRSGHIIAERGYAQRPAAEELAALAAAAFAATEHVARLIGETSFSVLFHQGEQHNLHLSIVGANALLLAAFDDRTTLGLVRLYAVEAAGSLVTVVEQARGRSVVGLLPDSPEGDIFQRQSPEEGAAAEHSTTADT
jgi:predicted regulator of Ras-like GTPase activity (Roadblock/LC7/MglB family)